MSATSDPQNPPKTPPKPHPTRWHNFPGRTWTTKDTRRRQEAGKSGPVAQPQEVRHNPEKVRHKSKKLCHTPPQHTDRM